MGIRRITRLRWATAAVTACGFLAILHSSLFNQSRLNAGPAAARSDQFFSNLLKLYVPRHTSMLDENSLIWMHVLSDAVIAIAYFTIPIALVKLVRKRRDLRFNWVFSCFAVFLLACGAEHVVSMVTIWFPYYRLEGLVKFITAVASIATAIVIWPLMPKLLAIPVTAELNAANEELRHTSSRFQTLVESAKEYAIFMLDVQGNIQTWNAGAERLKGYTAEQAIGKNFAMFYPKDDREQHKPERELEIATREGRYEEDGWRVRADGSKFLANVIITAVRDQAGTLTGFSKITRDLTEKKTVEATILDLNRSLLQRNANLETANKELESFSYSVSHDLRAPLRSIDGFSQALLDDCKEHLNAQGREYLRRVRTASERMGQLIDDLLNLSRVARTEVRLETTNLSKMAMDICNDCKAADPERNVTLKITGGLTAEADAGLMRIVLTNLIGNAWKFSGKQPDPAIEFGCNINGATTEYFVRDNGAGFDMEFVNKLFGAFQRLHSDNEFPGTGIGLATVQRIIHRHGGTVRAEAEKGIGAAFYFTLGTGNGLARQSRRSAA